MDGKGGLKTAVAVERLAGYKGWRQRQHIKRHCEHVVRTQGALREATLSVRARAKREVESLLPPSWFPRDPDEVMRPAAQVQPSTDRSSCMTSNSAGGFMTGGGNPDLAMMPPLVMMPPQHSHGVIMPSCMAADSAPSAPHGQCNNGGGTINMHTLGNMAGGGMEDTRVRRGIEFQEPAETSLRIKRISTGGLLRSYARRKLSGLACIAHARIQDSSKGTICVDDILCGRI